MYIKQIIIVKTLRRHLSASNADDPLSETKDIKCRSSPCESLDVKVSTLRLTVELLLTRCLVADYQAISFAPALMMS